MVMESPVCYICCDKRRTADTDTAVSKIGNRHDSEVLKGVLLRALSVGYVEDNPSEEDTSRTSYGVCVISLNSQYDGNLQALCNRVADDSVIICRRCEKLLKDFEYHERTSAKIAKDIQAYLSRQGETKEGSGGDAATSPASSPTVVAHRKLDERQSIQAAFKALRKSGLTGAKKRGRKRKCEQVQLAEASCTIPETEGEEKDEVIVVEGEDTQEQEAMASSRTSKRIQRRREEGLVVRWGDAGYGEENFSVEPNVESGEEGDSLEEIGIKHDMQPRKRRGRRPNRLKLLKPVDGAIMNISSPDLSSLKYQCPFCQRYYVPSNSRVHSCTSYKNQLRCQTCNIFFTSYIRLEKHLEVIHLRQRQLQCPEEGCKYTCISEPAFLLHKHFHFLSERESDGSDGMTCASGNVTEGEPEHVGQVTVLDDDQGVVTSPDMAEQVSFLLDEKSFLADGRPINIMTDVKRFAEIRGPSKGFQVLSNKVSEVRTEMNKSEHLKLNDSSSQNKTLTIQNVTISGSQCPFCDMTVDGQKNLDNHIRDVHRLVVKSKIKESSLKDKRIKDLLKKNFNLVSSNQMDIREEQAGRKKSEN